ncbi:MAG TPA: glycine cleavage system aminomethyltransferase GcvT [Acidimicrobiales bacterium]|nr:glycine cleavage system aminomethyltransferase GcvT [Acidimicrobiales bacterium]
MAQAAPPDGVPRRSPLHEAHLALSAKMMPFGGWDMPLAYPDGTVAEHRACRTDAVAFDVSHLGTVRVDGPGGLDLLQRALTNDLRRIGPGRAQYTHLLDDDGSVADDIIVWWVDQDRFDVMPNASNTSRVLGAVGGADVTADRAVVAVQGPHAREHLSSVAPDAAAVGRFRVIRFRWAGHDCVAAGTGYTGEDGVECAVPADAAPAFWEAVLAAGVRPAGLGARDTLRLEAGLPLHGHELGPGITPLQAGLGWVVGWDKDDFRGRTALEKERADGPRRRLRGLVADGRQPLRDGADVVAGPGTGRVVGRVTSGNFSPMRQCGIALAFLDTDAALDTGDRVTVVVRGRDLPATVSPLPFWPVPTATAGVGQGPHASEEPGVGAPGGKET